MWKTTGQPFWYNCTYEPLMKLLYSYCVNRHQMIKSNKSDRYYERWLLVLQTIQQQQQKKIKCFRLCHLNDLNAPSLSSISPPVPQHCTFQRKSPSWSQWREKCRDKCRLECIDVIHARENGRKKKSWCTFFCLYNPLNVVDIWPLRVELLKRAGMEMGWSQRE